MVYAEYKVNLKQNKALLFFVSNESKRLCRHLLYEQKSSSFKNKKELNEYSFSGENSVKLQIDDKTVIAIEGKIDRIDEWGDYIRIIDYKTGNTNLEYISMQDVFGISQSNDNDVSKLRNKGKSQILQTMLYCFILSNQYPRLAPYVYSTRRIADPNVITCVHPKHTEAPLVFDDILRQEFQEELMVLISEILNLDVPYSPTVDTHTCEYCAFAQLCGK